MCAHNAFIHHSTRIWYVYLWVFIIIITIFFFFFFYDQKLCIGTGYGRNVFLLYGGPTPIEFERNNTHNIFRNYLLPVRGVRPSCRARHRNVFSAGFFFLRVKIIGSRCRTFIRVAVRSIRFQIVVH